ncbi:MAG TPA: hypothetical protein VIK78_12010 [Ruminiclostridium sp.]
MRLKSVIKYNISETKYRVLIFYGILAAIMALIGCSQIFLTKEDIISQSSGFELPTIIFLFVLGLNSFKQNYLFLSTNGITRKEQFYGFLISSIPIVAVMGAIDIAFGNILMQLSNYNSLFNMIYEGWVIDTAKPIIILVAFIWSTVLCLFAIVLGYFITTSYYRMSKMMKVIVSIGVPALFFNILPLIDSVFTNGKVLGWFEMLFISLAGLKNGYNPLTGIVSLLIGASVLAGLAFLLVRRAPVKE